MDELGFHRALFRPGTIVDIGAHDGGFTHPLAAMQGARVVAFEPLPRAHARLLASFGGALPAHVTVHAVALGAEAGRVVLEVPYVQGVAQEQWASTAKDYAAIQAMDGRVDGVERVEVAVRRLDDFALADVTAIKLDAEGAEEDILRGAAATLRRWRPVLSVEIEERHRAGATRAVPALLAGLGYRGFFHLDGAWQAMARFDAGRMQRASPSPASYEVSDPYVFCFFFVPPERVDELLSAGFSGSHGATASGTAP